MVQSEVIMESWDHDLITDKMIKMTVLVPVTTITIQTNTAGEPIVQVVVVLLNMSENSTVKLTPVGTNLLFLWAKSRIDGERARIKSTSLWMSLSRNCKKS